MICSDSLHSLAEHVQERKLIGQISGLIWAFRKCLLTFFALFTIFLSPKKGINCLKLQFLSQLNPKIPLDLNLNFEQIFHQNNPLSGPEKVNVSGILQFITIFTRRAKSASNNTTTIMECDSCWVPNGQHGPVLY